MKYTGLLLASLALSIESALQKHENFHQYNLLGVYANGQGRQVPRNEVSQQPPLTRGWATQYAHAESSQGPCKGIVESVFAVPTGVCLTGLTSVQSSFEYVCNASK